MGDRTGTVVIVEWDKQRYWNSAGKCARGLRKVLITCVQLFELKSALLSQAFSKLNVEVLTDFKTYNPR